MNRVETGKISERVQQSAAVLAEVITEAFTASVVKFERLAEKIANAEPLFNRETALALVHAFAGMLANAEPELPKTKKERRLGINRLAILLLLLVLLAACGREGTTTVDVGVGEVTITQTTEETGEVAPEASPAPIAVTVEAENGNGDGTPPDSETIEVPEEDETPETIETPIPESKILVAAAQSGVLLSKEDISANPFISVAHKGDRRVMYRMANNNLQIIATVDAGTTVNFYQYADGTLNHDGTVTGSDGNTLGAINSEAVFTPTPAPEPAPEPGNGTGADGEGNEGPGTPESPGEGEDVETESPLFTVEELNEEPIYGYEINQWPINPTAAQGYRGYIAGRIGQPEPTDIRYEYGPNQYDYLDIRLLLPFHYVDANGQQQQVWTIGGTVTQNNRGHFFTYGNIMWPQPIGNQHLYTGEVMIDKMEEMTQNLIGWGENPKLSQGDWGTVTMIKGTDPVASNLSQDLDNPHIEGAMYGLTQSWTEDQVQLFWETGDPQYLPTLPDGRPFIPSLVGFTWDKDSEALTPSQ